MSELSGVRCLVSGRVQGVWFRAFTKEKATQLGICGFARNLNDGQVEVLAYGKKDQLELFCCEIKQGPKLAQVTHFSCEEVPWKNYFGFDTL